jgi:hypothetical protein
MSDFYINDTEYCLADEYFCSLTEKTANFKNDDIEYDQCFLDNEVRSIEITRAINQIELGKQFAFYNLGFSEKELELLSNVGIEELNDITINTSINKLKELKQEVSLALTKMQGVDVLRLDGLSNLITRLVSVVIGELEAEEFELKIRSMESYRSKENCMYWHLDKSKAEKLGNTDITKEKRFIIVLKGEGTLYKKISDEQREEFMKVAKEAPSFYGHGIKACKVDDGINQLFNQQETFITKSQYGSVHIAGYNGTIHAEPKESESRLILLLTPKIKVI